MKELTHGTKVCLALGYFDSVHLGHRKIISIAKDIAKDSGIGCAVATFSNNAYKVFNPDGKAVNTYRERCELLEGLCDYVLPMRFDARLKEKSAADFLDGLFHSYDISAVVCGYDYLFGAGAKGDAEFLKAYCENKGVKCVVADKFELNGVRVSTTLVKECLAKGDIRSANLYLGAPYSLGGKVIHGRGAGRMFDIPTANIKVSNEKMLPKCGVYACKCVIDGGEYACATNIGARPTFGLSKTTVETMIHDFSDNIYGKDIKVYFAEYLRPVKKFETPAELSVQAHKDLDRSAEIKW